MKTEKKEIDITKDFYLCSPLLNTECSKESCYINNGPCCHTVNKEHSQQYLLDHITNLREENVVLKSQLLQDNKSYHDMQDRIKKAIQYIKENSYFEGNEIKTMIYQDYSKYILETLQGKSDE